MARKPQPNDFTVDVPDVGTFTFAHRTMRDEIAIQVEYARIIDGVEATEWLQTVGGWISVFRVLTVRAPADWILDEMDPLENETYAKMNAVYEVLREKEDSFRGGAKPKGEGRSA